METGRDLRDGGPLVAGVEMGYGHLRAAAALADHLGVPLEWVDRPPLATAEEEALWRRVRLLYETTSRMSQRALVGAPFRWLLQAATEIGGHRRTPVPPGRAERRLADRIEHGLGAGLAERLTATGRTLVTTFYAPALAAARLCEARVVCVVTDTDLHRIWAPVDPAGSRIEYCVPSRRAVRRLVSYGVPHDRIHLTGFPLPPELLGGRALPALKRDLAARLSRLDPRRRMLDANRRQLESQLPPLPRGERDRPPHLVFAVGGAGAQAGTARSLLAALAGSLRRGRARLTLIAGTHADVAARFRRWIGRAGLGDLPEGSLAVLHEPGFDRYYREFNRVLATADLLVTKPSELVFFTALGVPLLMTAPVGHHERLNRRWVLRRGAGWNLPPAGRLAEWLQARLEDGALAEAAWAGYRTTPRRGTYRIAALVAGPSPTADHPLSETADGP